MNDVSRMGDRCMMSERGRMGDRGRMSERYIGDREMGALGVKPKPGCRFKARVTFTMRSDGRTRREAHRDRGNREQREKILNRTE